MSNNNRAGIGYLYYPDQPEKVNRLMSQIYPKTRRRLVIYGDTSLPVTDDATVEEAREVLQELFPEVGNANVSRNGYGDIIFSHRQQPEYCDDGSDYIENAKRQSKDSTEEHIENLEESVEELKTMVKDLAEGSRKAVLLNGKRIQIEDGTKPEDVLETLAESTPNGESVDAFEDFQGNFCLNVGDEDE